MNVKKVRRKIKNLEWGKDFDLKNKQYFFAINQHNKPEQHITLFFLQS